MPNALSNTEGPQPGDPFEKSECTRQQRRTSHEVLLNASFQRLENILIAP